MWSCHHTDRRLHSCKMSKHWRVVLLSLPCSLISYMVHRQLVWSLKHSSVHCFLLDVTSCKWSINSPPLYLWIAWIKASTTSLPWNELTNHGEQARQYISYIWVMHWAVEHFPMFLYVAVNAELLQEALFYHSYFHLLQFVMTTLSSEFPHLSRACSHIPLAFPYKTQRFQGTLFLKTLP